MNIVDVFCHQCLSVNIIAQKMSASSQKSSAHKKLFGTNPKTFERSGGSSSPPVIRSVHFSGQLHNVELQNQLIIGLNSNNLSVSLYILIILAIWPCMVVGFLSTVYFTQNYNTSNVRCLIEELEHTNWSFSMIKQFTTPRHTQPCIIYSLNYKLYAKLSYNKSLELLFRKPRSLKKCTQFVYRPGTAFNVVHNFKKECASNYLNSYIWFIGLFTRSLGCIIFGIAADLFGRRLMFQINAIACIIFIFCTVLSSTSWTLMICCGLALGTSFIAFLISFISFVETLPYRMRPYMSQIILAGSGFTIIAMAFINVHLSHFRYNFVMFGIFSLVMAFGAWYIPESPRWLLAYKDYVKVREVLEQLNINYDLSSSLNDVDILPNERSTVLHQLTLLFRKRFLKRILSNIFLVVVVYVSFSSFPYDSVMSTSQYLILHGCFVLLRPLTGTLLIYFFGRRLSLCYLSVLLAVLNGMALTNSNLAILASFLGLVLGSCFASISYLYTVELYPVIHVGTMMGVVNGVASVILLICLIVQYCMEYDQNVIYIFKLALNILITMIVLQMPETSTTTQPLTDIEAMKSKMNKQNIT